MAEVKKIASAVGAPPAENSVRDQQTVRDLLMRILPEDGGPDYIIPNPVGPGMVTQELQWAIVVFQSVNVPAADQTGRVEPDGMAMLKLNELARDFFPVDSLIFPKDGAAAAPSEREPASNLFYIRMTGSGSAGDSLEGDVLFFEIWDPANFLSAPYKYGGAGLGLGVPARVQTKGPWNMFQVKTPRQVSSFGTRLARFTTIGGGPFSDNFLNLLGLGDSIYLNLKAGFEIGGGLSSSVGQFWWYPAVVKNARYAI